MTLLNLLCIFFIDFDIGGFFASQPVGVSTQSLNVDKCEKVDDNISDPVKNPKSLGGCIIG